MKFSIAIRTCDRSPQANYLEETITNLVGHGGAAATRVNRSESIPFEVLIGDGRQSENEAWRSELNRAANMIDGHVVNCRDKTPNQNAGTLLLEAATADCDWVIFLEDDLDFCSDFLESVDLWLRDWARDDRRVYSLCCGFKHGNMFNNPMPIWDMPAGVFFGTQAFVMRRDDAKSFGEYLMALDPIKVPTTLDFQLVYWLFENHPTAPYITCSVPSIVQHIGKESSIHNGRFHAYRSFQRGYKYCQSENPAIFTLHEASTPKRSPRLAQALKKILPKSKPVYDFGCGVGYYLKELEQAGYMVHGYEGTPRIRSISDTRRISEQDLMVDMHFKPFWLQYGIDPTKDSPLLLGGASTDALELHRTPMLDGSCISIEVAEHIPGSHLMTYLSNITKWCNGKLVISWALPGQGGLRHVSEANPDFVIDGIETHPYKFRFNKRESEMLRAEAGQDFDWFKKSIYVFDRTDFSNRQPTPKGLKEFWETFGDMDHAGSKEDWTD